VGTEQGFLAGARQAGDPSADAVIWTASGVFPSVDPELIRIAQAQPA
jgi:hypothetical protein